MLFEITQRSGRWPWKRSHLPDVYAHKTSPRNSSTSPSFVAAATRSFRVGRWRVFARNPPIHNPLTGIRQAIRVQRERRLATASPDWEIRASLPRASVSPSEGPAEDRSQPSTCAPFSQPRRADHWRSWRVLSLRRVSRERHVALSVTTRPSVCSVEARRGHG